MRHLFSIMQIVGLVAIAVACFLFNPILGLLAVGIELFGVGYVMETDGGNA